MIGCSFSIEVENLLFTLRLAIDFRTGISFTWTLFDAHEGEDRRFLRRGSVHAEECDEDLAERFRRAG